MSNYDLCNPYRPKRPKPFRYLLFQTIGALLIWASCLHKLAEESVVNLPAHTKLKLLDRTEPNGDASKKDVPVAPGEPIR